MRQYGGKLRISLPDDGHEYESQGEYKYISVKYLNELFSHRDEYKDMFEEYFQKYKDILSSDESKDFEIKRLTKALQYKDIECKTLQQEVKVRDGKITSLKEELSIKSTENDELSHQLTICEAKVERAYQLKYDEEVKVKDLTKKVTNMQKKIKELVTTTKILRAKTQGLEKGYAEVKKENIAIGKANNDLEIEVVDLRSCKDEMRFQISNMERENGEVLKINKMLKEKLDSNKQMFMEMQKLINANCKFTKSKKFKFFRKQSKKSIIIEELKLMLANTFSNI